MVQSDPAAAAAKWAQNLSQATAAITAGVQSVQTAPGVKAAAQKQVWVNNTTAAQNKWAQRTAAVPLGDWQSAMINKGVPRISSGATAAVPKMQTFMTKLLPYINSQVSSLPPRGDLGANINRMVAFTQAMAKFSNS